MNPVQKVLKDAGMEKSDIDKIVMVGGSTRIPKFQQLVKKFFNGKEPSRGINPEEAVAYGAAVQAAILSRQEDTEHVILVDVCPLTLGIETEGENMAKIIPRNTVLPVSMSKLFTTAEGSQTTVTIKVFEGEHPLTKHNNLLGTFNLTDIPPAPQGEPQIEVTFEMNENGILIVTARAQYLFFKPSNAKITIANNHNRLSKEDIEWMVKDAQRFADEDKKLKECITARNELESYTYHLKDQLGDQQSLGSKLSDTDRETIEKAVQEKIEWMESYPKANTVRLKAKKKELEKVVEPFIRKHCGGAGIPCPEEDAQKEKDEL